MTKIYMDQIQKHRINNIKFLDSSEDMIIKEARQELIIDKVKKIWTH